MSPKTLIAAISSALTTYDRDITVKATDFRGQKRLLIGEKTKRAFKPLGYVDVLLTEDGDLQATDGRPDVTCKFTARSETLTAKVMGAF